jgi:hypothetical protein
MDMPVEALRIFGTSASTCNAKVSSQLAPMDADITDVRNNWKPSGFYTPEQVRQIVVFGLRVKTSAFVALETAMKQSQIPSHRGLLEKAHADFNDDRRLDAERFVQGVQAAEAQGIEVIEAQGLKRWVLFMLEAVRSVKGDVLFVDCARPSAIFGVIDALDRASKALVDLVLTVTSTVADAAVAVGKAVLKIPDLFSSFVSFLKILPWFVVVGGGYYIGVRMGWIPAKYDPAHLRNRDPFNRFRLKQLPPGDD